VLPPDSRAILSDLLRPPVGFTLARAVGTSFTLDLTAALAVPLCFAAWYVGATPDPIGVMEAVRGAADRVDVFYQAGQAAVPTYASDVLAFLEPVLHAVRAPRPGSLFHPKVWALKFMAPDGTAAYRLVCSSRNLTHDKSWDAVISIDGAPGRRREPWNQPIRALLETLPLMCTQPLSRDRAAAISVLAEELHKAEWDLPEDAINIDFFALGVPSAKPVPDYGGNRHLVVSPFIEEGGLARVAPSSREVILVSRPQQIDRLGTIGAGLDLRVMSVMAELDEERAAGDLSGLHAKMVIVERGHRAHLFLGSANATYAAHTGNVEFVVEVIRGKKKYGIDAHLSEITGFGSLLEEYSQQTPLIDAQEELRFELENLVRAIAALPWTVTAAAAGDDSYTLVIASGAALPATGARISLELVTLRGEAKSIAPIAVAEVTLTGVALPDITPFLLISVDKDGARAATVVPGHLVNDPHDRLDAVLARQVDTPEKFLRFLLLVLGLSNEPGPAAGGGGDAGGATWTSTRGPALFELIARALADSPSVLEDLTAIVDSLSRTEKGLAVMPEGFLDLWSTVQEAQKLVGARS